MVDGAHPTKAGREALRRAARGRMLGEMTDRSVASLLHLLFYSLRLLMSRLHRLKSALDAHNCAANVSLNAEQVFSQRPQRISNIRVRIDPQVLSFLIGQA